MTSPDPTPRQIIVFVLYSVLCLPASMTVAGFAATRITQNVSNFEGGAGYAALWWIIVLTCVFYGLSIALFALLRKRIAILAAVTVAFAALSVPAFRFIYELATWARRVCASRRKRRTRRCRPRPPSQRNPKTKRPDLAIGPFGFRWAGDYPTNMQIPI
ncbi:hypothetical protein [Burkholderia cepacia]|uniref:hypothetical protein n=1 Tax=Burkholderia cepacia TaxID=292 RepID=UPI000B05DE64|nr:hypothetical protein [Burkholderia cepacia]